MMRCLWWCRFVVVFGFASAALTSSPTTTPACDCDVIIIGGGLAGMAMGVALSNRAVSCDIYEQAPELRRVGAAIGLYPNGITALGWIAPSVLRNVAQSSIPTRYCERRDLNNQLLQTTDTQDIQATSPVLLAWYLLQQLLAEALPPGVLRMGMRMESFEQNPKDGTVKVHFHNALQPKRCKVLIGADGIHSTVRRQLLGPPQVQHHGKVMYRAAMDKLEGICPPAGTQISYQGDEKGKSFSVRETTNGVMTITAAAISSDPITTGGNAHERKQRFARLFQEFPGPVQQILDSLDPYSIHEDFIRDVNVPPQWSQGSVVIMGDAAHAMTPHMGQGANVGLEDVCELTHYLVPALTGGNKDDIEHALQQFCQCRIERATEIQAQSRQNSAQSNTFDRQSASVPFERRKYSESFKERLYNWQPHGSRHHN